MKYALIGLVGHAGAGKDTAAAALVEVGYVNLKFAGALKAMMRALLKEVGYDSETVERMLEGDLKETRTSRLNFKTPRHAMQTIGNEWGRLCMGEDFWMNVVQRRVWETPRAVFSDCRYPNEVDMVRRNGGAIVKIERPGLAVDLSHASEQFISSIEADLVLENTADTPEKFQDLVRIWFDAAIARKEA